MTRGVSPEVRQETVERKQDTKAELQKLKDDIQTEQNRILARGADRRHNKRYDEKLKNNSNVLIGKVDKMVTKIETTDALTLTRKVTMLQEIYSILNNYIRGLDGLFTQKDNVTLKLSGLLSEFDTEIDNKRIIQNHEEEVSAPKVIINRNPDRAEVVKEGLYIAETGDTLTGIVDSKFHINWKRNPRAAFAVVKMLNDEREGKDANDLDPGDEVKIGVVKAKLGSNGMPSKEQMQGAIAWYNGLDSTIAEGWKIGAGAEASSTASVGGVESSVSTGGGAPADADATANATATVNVTGVTEKEKGQDKDTVPPTEKIEPTPPVTESIDLGKVEVNGPLTKEQALSAKIISGTEETEFVIAEPAKWGWLNDNSTDYTVIKLPTEENIDQVKVGALIKGDGAKELGLFTTNAAGEDILKSGFAWRNSYSDSYDVVKLPAAKTDKSYVEDAANVLNSGALVENNDAKALGIIKADGSLEDKWGFQSDEIDAMAIRLPNGPDKEGVTDVANLPEGVMVPVAYAEKLGLFAGKGGVNAIDGWQWNTPSLYVFKVAKEVPATADKKEEDKEAVTPPAVVEKKESVETPSVLEHTISIDDVYYPFDKFSLDSKEVLSTMSSEELAKTVEMLNTVMLDSRGREVEMLADPKAPFDTEDDDMVVFKEAGFGFDPVVLDKLPVYDKLNFTQIKDMLNVIWANEYEKKNAPTSPDYVDGSKNPESSSEIMNKWVDETADHFKDYPYDNEYEDKGPFHVDPDDGDIEFSQAWYDADNDVSIPDNVIGYSKYELCDKLNAKWKSLQPKTAEESTVPPDTGAVDSQIEDADELNAAKEVPAELSEEQKSKLNEWVKNTVEENINRTDWDKEEHPEGPFYKGLVAVVDELLPCIRYADDMGSDDLVPLPSDLENAVGNDVVIKALNDGWNRKIAEKEQEEVVEEEVGERP